MAELRAREVAIAARTKLERSEKEKRVLRIGGAVLAFLLLLAFGSFIYAEHERSVAQNSLTQSIKTANDLKVQKDWSGNIVKSLYEFTTGEADTRLHAVNQLKAMDSQGNLPRELAPVIVAVTANDKNNDIADAARYFFSLAAPDANNDVTVAILKSAESNSALTDATDLTPRVYIQVAGDSQRARASLIAAELRKNGFTVPGFQLVDERHAPTGNELRFYTSQDETQSQDPNVAKILSIVTEKDNQRWTAYRLKQSTNVRSGHYELWFGRDSSDPDGILKLKFTDEENNQIWPEKFRVTLKSQRGFLLPSQDETDISVPPGKYSLKIRAQVTKSTRVTSR